MQYTDNEAALISGLISNYFFQPSVDAKLRESYRRVLRHLRETLQRVIPVLWQRQHLREQTICLEGQRMVAKMVVGHDRVTFGFFNTENRHFCNLLFLGFQIYKRKKRRFHALV